MDLFESLKTYLSEKEIKDLEEALKHPSLHAALLNPAKMSDVKFIELFPNVKPHPIVKHAFIYDKNEYELGKHVLHELGAYYLQEPSAMLPAFLLNPNNNDIVLDLCAAPGGKSVQASFLMENQGVILSNDLSHSRALAILENSERLGIANIAIMSRDFTEIYEDFTNYFTKIILDVPCSGSGMFRKSEAVKDDWSIEKVLRCQKIQKELILMAYEMLAPGGEMVYSTCSFSKEEDEDVVEELLSNTDAKIIDIKNDLFVAGKNDLGVHLLPNVFPGEGHYICLLAKPGELNNSTIKEVKFKPNKFVNAVNDLFVNKFGEALFYLENDDNLKKLSVIRKGVKLGEISGQVLKYDHHYATYISDFENELEIDLQSALKYISGESLNIPSKRGFILLKYMGINIDIAKSDGNIIKNRYPKYLRKKLV